MIPVQFYRQTGRYGDPVIKRAHTEETRQLDILSAVSDQSAPSMASLNSSGHKNALGASTNSKQPFDPRAIQPATPKIKYAVCCVRRQPQYTKKRVDLSR